MSAMRRAVVLGLDGMPLDLARDLASRAVMPGLRDLFSTGALAELIAPVPEISSTSWVTFLTGANPGRHGIYGFTDLVPGTYDVYFPNRTHIRGPVLWDHLGPAGMRTLSLNVPGTYPAPSMAGKGGGPEGLGGGSVTVVSGFVAPNFERAISPPQVAETLTRYGYQIEVDAVDAGRSPRVFLDRLRAVLDSRVRAFADLLARDDWEVAVAVITETDRLQHFYWAQVVDPAGELHEPIIDFYRAVDEAVSALVAAVPDDVDRYLVSDHGFGPADCQFHVNAWLRERGWLAPLGATPTLRDLDRSSQVFALDPGRFYLNRADRFPGGGLSAKDADHLTDELCSALRELPGPDGRAPLMAEVYRREDIYHGPLLDRAPDVVAVPAIGVQLRGAWKPAPAGTAPNLTGTHTRRNAIFWTSRDDVRAATVDMVDVAPTILGGVGLHPALDGRDLTRMRSDAIGVT
jgi:predicted AlkP superfamily phosphohydrolase/phosphomutase